MTYEILEKVVMTNDFTKHFMKIGKTNLYMLYDEKNV